MNVKKYIIWAGDMYYPRIGLNDIIGTYDTVEECKNHLITSSTIYDWWIIVRHADMIQVESGGSDGTP